MNQTIRNVFFSSIYNLCTFFHIKNKLINKKKTKSCADNQTNVHIIFKHEINVDKENKPNFSSNMGKLYVNVK